MRWPIGWICGAWGASCFVVAGCGQSADDRPVSWSYISVIIVQPNCATASCHATITQRSGIDLSTIKGGYESLVKNEYVFRNNVKPSPLPKVLRGIDFPRRMPPDFGLPNDDIGLIERWIAAGAAYDGPGTPAVPP
jgi:hypothetical protein